MPVWERCNAGGGFILGGVGAFLVLEARAHAEARGASAYARIAHIMTDRCNRAPGEVRRSMVELFERLRATTPTGPLPVLSGASGVEPSTSEEIEFLDYLPACGIEPVVRAYGSEVGHGVEAHFPIGLALAALAIRYGHLPSPRIGSGIERPFAGAVERALLTCVGHWRGEGLALVEAAR
jgi:3-oxoacyl-[acyl-carrier-protein] synthase II